MEANTYLGVFLYCIRLDDELHWVFHTGHLVAEHLIGDKAGLNLAESDFRNADNESYMRKCDGTTTLLKPREKTGNWQRQKGGDASSGAEELMKKRKTQPT